MTARGWGLPCFAAAAAWLIATGPGTAVFHDFQFTDPPPQRSGAAAVPVSAGNGFRLRRM